MDIKGSIVILGSEWQIDFLSIENDSNLEEKDGYCDKSTKTIVVRLDNNGGFGNFEEVQKSIIRHEVIHAFLIESGLDNNWQHPSEFGHDETTVDWFAIQWHKINKVFEELGI